MALEALKEIEDEEEELEISKKACKLDAHLLDIARPLASQKNHTAAIWPFENCLSAFLNVEENSLPFFVLPF